MTQFNADIGAVNALGQQLDDVSSSASNVLNGAIGSVSDSHGAIGFPMQSSFDGTQASRSAAVAATQAASGELGGLLRQAAQAYERGDTAAAERLRAQAAELEGSGAQRGSPTGAATPGGAGSPGGGGAPAGQDSGSQAAGQMLGQMGQMMGQMAQSVTQPIQGMTQGLSQIPQQVMQGVQGIVQAATQGGGGAAQGGAETLEKAKAEGADGAKDGEKPPVDAKDGKESKDARDRDGQGHQAGKQTGSESHRSSQVGNRAPDAGVTPKPAGPTAPTRPM
ncbi:hypothetical protein A5784_11500 [Mycobacterium sp. 852013-50091_SCH5140682]|uniref:type VII secretion target n=1 Tax=Mycobacterium sp. 852013-50091_SCH5140682 TaxID=1834109 RepID=UPI0007EC0D60|nr:type VII secretion target [Mycobacterium sp. 852013-50091_SCH5140682]OBC05066.1 hypothetical protein A5784_11500 [Mycobacterium sp. 852013-50091_SCH5140682]